MLVTLDASLTGWRLEGQESALPGVACGSSSLESVPSNAPMLPRLCQIRLIRSLSSVVLCPPDTAPLRIDVLALAWPR